MAKLRSPRGVVLISGSIGSGKTGMALGCGAKPEKIALLDWDGKDPNIDLGLYVNYSSMLSDKKQVGTFQHFWDTISKIKPNQYDAIIIDNWGGMSSAMLPWIVKNHSQVFQVTASAGEWKHRQILGGKKKVEANMLVALSRLCHTAFAIAHETPDYVNKERTAYKTPDFNSETLSKAVGAFWLQRSPTGSTPDAIIWKSPPTRKWMDGQIKSIPYLPPRLSREALGRDDGGYVSLWDIHEHYVNNPYDPSDAKPFERLNDHQSNLVLNTLSDQEREGIEQQKKQAATFSKFTDDMIQCITANLEKSTVAIIGIMRDKYPDVSVTPVDINTVVDSLKNNL